MFTYSILLKLTCILYFSSLIQPLATMCFNKRSLLLLLLLLLYLAVSLIPQ